MRRSELRPSPKGKMPLSDWVVPVHYARRKISFPQLRSARKDGAELGQALDDLREKAFGTPEAPEPENGYDSLQAIGRFIGRDEYFLELERAIRSKGVIVIHGVGGCGKTELAKAFARWLGASGGLNDSQCALYYSFEPGLGTFGIDGVVTSLGLALCGADFVREFPEADKRREAMIKALHDRRILLIWDNFETVHSMPDPKRPTPLLSAEELKLVKGFLRRANEAANIGILITSRSPEQWLGADVSRIELGGLSSQESAEYADYLLAEHPSAQQRREKRAYGELIEFLDGHALSLRLILPHLATTDAQVLVDGLKESGNSPSDVESSEGRLESLAACISYSFRKLPEADKKRVPALSLFEGTVDIGVLTVLSMQDSAPARFRGTSDEEWHRMLATCCQSGLLSRTAQPSVYRMHPALPGYLAAFWRKEAGDAFANERRALEKSKPDAAQRILAVAYHQLGVIARKRGQWERAEALLMKSLRLEEVLGNRKGMATSYHELGRLAQQQGDYQAAETWDRKALDLRESLGNDREEAREYHELGNVARRRGELDGAERLYRKSLGMRESLGDRHGMAESYIELGTTAALRGDYALAESMYRDSLGHSRAIGARPIMVLAYGNLGILAWNRNMPEAGLEWTIRCVALFDTFPHPATGPAPTTLAQMTAALGLPALKSAWLRVTGNPLPAAVEQVVQQVIRTMPA